MSEAGSELYEGGVFTACWPFSPQHQTSSTTRVITRALKRGIVASTVNVNELHRGGERRIALGASQTYRAGEAVACAVSWKGPERRRNSLQKNCLQY